MRKERIIFLTTKDNVFISCRYLKGISHLTKYHLMKYFEDNYLNDILNSSYKCIKCEDDNRKKFDNIIIDNSIKRDYLLINYGGGYDFIAVIEQIKKEKRK